MSTSMSMNTNHQQPRTRLILALQVAVATTLCLRSATSFVCISPSTSRASRFHAATSSGDNDKDPDLFDYFDPLLSPHAYPNGISPKSSVGDDETGLLPPPQEIDEFTLLGLLSSTTTTTSTTTNNDDNGVNSGAVQVPKVAAPADVFDPRVSPHAYPNGTPDQVDSTTITSSNNKDEDPMSDDNDSPLTFSFLTGVSTRTTNPDTVAPGVDEQPDFFDPRLSPHIYTNGAPDTFVGDIAEPAAKKKKIGVLLMDHGSRNQASNDRLHELARLYQQSHAAADMVVTAAHMEIAPPSIPDGLRVLLDSGVDEIICHPYFLSANGRHVSEDIPEILEAAKESLDITIPLVTTEPVGSQTDVMIRAMHSLVVGVAASK